MNLKKTIRLLWVMLCVIAGIMAVLNNREGVYAEVQGDFRYCYEDYAGGIVILEYTGTSAELVIPEEIAGSKVVVIENGVFNGCDSLKSVTIPSGMRGIGFRQFRNCSNLTEFKVAEGNAAYRAEDGLLYNAEGTKLIYCPEGKSGDIALLNSIEEVDDFAFNGCSKIERLKLPATVNSIGEIVFAGCENLKEIEIAADNMDYRAEDGILYNKEGTRLKCCPAGKAGKITVLKSVLTVADYAFYGCNHIETIELSAALEEIGESAFEGCDNLKEVDVEAGNLIYKSADGILYNKAGTELKYCPGGKSGIIIVPDGVQVVDENAFLRCHKIESVKLPATVEQIKASLGSCKNLKEIEAADNPFFQSEGGILYSKDGTELISYPGGKTGEVKLLESVRKIGNMAFMYCENVKEIKLHSGITSIGVSAFNKCENLESITLPSGMKSIENFAFYQCKSLVHIELPLGIESIGNFAFAYCENLKSILLPDGLKNIKSSAFQSCKSLASVVLPEGIKKIELCTFNDCFSLSSITIPASVTEMEAGTICLLSRYNLKDIYYAGSEGQWDKIESDYGFGFGVDIKKLITIHYNSSPNIPDKPTGPTTPSKPDQPVEPTVPSAPSNPTGPTAPNTPSNPIEPTNPTQPLNPVIPDSEIRVSFDSQGGYYVSDIITGKDAALTYIPVTSRNGYIFQGWYTGVNGTGSMLTLGTVIGENTTYYAYWTAAGRTMTGITVSVNGTPYTGSSIYAVLSVRAVYSDWTSEQVYDYSVSQTVIGSGNNLVTVTYRGFIQRITIQAVPVGTNTAVRNILVSYTGGAVPVGTYEIFGGLTVRAEYADGTIQEVQGYTLSTHSIGKGNNKITVSYGGRTADFYVEGYQYSSLQVINIDGIPDLLLSEETQLLSVLQNFIPTKPGHTFEGWYLDESCTQKVTAGMYAASGTHVYAKWEKIYNWALNKTNVSVKKGKKIRLFVSGLDSGSVVWKSSDNKTAKVSKQGIVKAKKKGRAVITAITADGTVMTCSIQVKR